MEEGACHARAYAATGQYGSVGTLKHGAAVSFGLLAIGALVMSSGVAGAAPQPTVAEVQQKLAQLTSQAQKLDQQYDQAQQELSAANQQLAAVDTEVARDQSQFDSMQAKVAEIALAAYENGALSSPRRCSPPTTRSSFARPVLDPPRAGVDQQQRDKGVPRGRPSAARRAAVGAPRPGRQARGQERAGGREGHERQADRPADRRCSRSSPRRSRRPSAPPRRGVARPSARIRCRPRPRR